ncbi:MAG: histidine triad nucleotide-binding protein [Oscillospiraceae bacterium]|nr:histidine triad nucleotide-binding protein [Oscillospiraceae bacterium]
MNSCVFCRIIEGELPAKKVYENDMTLAFYDIAPDAPIHIIVIPKLHIGSLAEITPENSCYAAACTEAIARIAGLLNLDSTGFRVITNHGKDAHQTIEHLHFHLLGGMDMGAKIVSENN